MNLINIIVLLKLFTLTAGNHPILNRLEIKLIRGGIIKKESKTIVPTAYVKINMDLRSPREIKLIFCQIENHLKAYYRQINPLDISHNQASGVINKIEWLNQKVEFMMGLPWINVNKSECNKYVANFKNLDRNRRGLINIGGRLMNFVFGTATESQVRRLRQESNQYMEMANYQIEIHRQQLVEIRRDIIDITTLGLKNAVKGVLRDVQIRLNHLNNYINEILDTSHKIDTAMNMASLKIFQSNIMDRLKFSAVINEASRKLKVHPIIEINNEESFKDYLLISNTKIISQSYQIQLEVPLYDGTKYEAYEIQPFPTVLNGNLRFELKDIPEVVILSTTSVREYPHKTDCKRTNELLVCPLLVPTTTNREENCPFQLINNLTLTSCKFNEIAGDTPIYKYLLNTWFLSAPKGISGQLSCQNKTYNYETYSGTLVIPPTCSLHSQELILTSPTQIEINKTWSELDNDAHKYLQLVHFEDVDKAILKPIENQIGKLDKSLVELSNKYKIISKHTKSKIISENPLRLLWTCVSINLIHTFIIIIVISKRIINRIRMYKVRVIEDSEIEIPVVTEVQDTENRVH